MEMNVSKFFHSLTQLRRNVNVKDNRLDEVLRLSDYDASTMDNIFKYVCQKIMDPIYTDNIGMAFSDILLLIVTSAFPLDSVEQNFELYQFKCVALSKLLTYNSNILKYSFKYFSNHEAPFRKENLTSVKRQKLNAEEITNLGIVKCCLEFLKADVSFYKRIWNWSEFIDLYWNEGCDLQRLYCNEIVAILINMNNMQMKAMNENIPTELIISTEIKFDRAQSDVEDILSNRRNQTWMFSSDSVTNVEGIFLPIYDVTYQKFYQNSSGRFENMVNVESTKMNLRSLALGVSSGKAICLCGPVGCGKTTLVEYLARKTGRIAPNLQEKEKIYFVDHQDQINLDSPNMKKNKLENGGLKRKGHNEILNGENHSVKEIAKNSTNPFLRIQLGNQTDSKMLLGQYRCTDVPGEFVWQPGVLTQAVLNGYWILLEDLDSATQDVCTVLTNLLENNYLSVPGFRDYVGIEPGFQLFTTMRTQKSITSHNSVFTLFEKYLYIINLSPLSKKELSDIVCENYPKLKTVAERIVDVFLTFSTCHSDEDKNNSEEELFSKQTKSLLPNSGRLVSTRDLLKLCKRSNPTFSVTSTECAYFVFQNAVDLFCSHLSDNNLKTDLIIKIGAKLGIIQSRCEFLSKEYKPDIYMNSIEMKVGRVQLNRKLECVSNDDDQSKKKRKSSDSEAVAKKMKIGNESLPVMRDLLTKTKVPFFSYTRLASCLLERITISVVQNEPVLLVGETGVGKTSSIQYLAYRTGHKLTVVNMNNQSEVSDLVGGFKPVDLSFIMTPLRLEFETLFKTIFNVAKNEKFLNNISICFNRGDFHILIKLMLKIVDTAFVRIKTDAHLHKANMTKKWQELHIKLLKLNSQLKNSINISFAFIPGSLVNCIKNGDWILLDEINLASTETLECLSTILEPDGSIVLLEKGDYIPIKRHPNFRIFACMNPNTDIGKKDLPVGIRNRFTEFFVDELTAENDLMTLVGDYLSSTGVQKSKVVSVVKLYRKLRSMAQLELNDGLGNRPIFSLRTLCRALTICAKNLCGSVDRNLYESFCLSFLTQLDQTSHKIVLSLIQKILLTNVKAILSYQIPKPSEGEQLLFEGYWIEKGPKEVNECDYYILTESVRQNLKDLARVISIGKLPVLLQGPTSAGKTSLIEYVAKKSGNYCLRINNHEHTDLQEYIGTYTADVTGKLVFKEGVLVQAMRHGYWIILDELNLAPSDILEALNRVLDDNRELFIPETQNVIKAHPNFMLFATQNPPGLYGGRKTLSRAFKNRFIELHFDEIPKPELEIILEKRCLIPKSYAQKMVKTMTELQMNRRNATRNNFTLRDLFRWGNRFTFADKKLLENHLYDWNQHLVDEGYLVLSAKVRNLCEIATIEQALFKTFRKKIVLDNLFDLHENTSLVTRNILENLIRNDKFANIVWTYDMRRMAVQTAKALSFDEPVLLVGPTGCGKTTICQILSQVSNRNLRILNCHMHSEAADFLGGLRPFRGNRDSEETGKKNRQLFEWANGPLVISMMEGGYFLADEISLAEDSVLERLNCILEPERTVLLAEKGGVDANLVLNSENIQANNVDDFIIKATDGFQFLATMNPGGDFGKKELSPALRNRFTEIWCKGTDSKEDLIQIAFNALRLGIPDNQDNNANLNNVSKVVVETIFYMKQTIEKFNFSVRDLLAWVEYIIVNTEDCKSINTKLTLSEAIIYGLETIFLDFLEMLPNENLVDLDKHKQKIFLFMENLMKNKINLKANIAEIQGIKGKYVERHSNKFGIYPFYVEINPSQNPPESDFMFNAPTTMRNLFQLLSALSLKKSILLEGPPGVGKTSLVESLAQAIGYNIVRINLCEHTDLADLFGTDLPADSKDLDLNFKDDHGSKQELTLGSFLWRDGPLLAALKARNTWILLDELNLAPQNVLEGLNAILDHRGEVYIPELNKTFKLKQCTRIFASQNPLHQGGGRKGLPQSFLNRFTKVYLRKLQRADLLHVIDSKYKRLFAELRLYFEVLLQKCNVTIADGKSFFEIMAHSCFDNNESGQISSTFKFDLLEKMVNFSEALDHGIANLEFGYKGGPFEINLRDILRWCDFLSNDKTGYLIEDNSKHNKSLQKLSEDYNELMLVLFEKMKLVYCQRMRTDSDRNYVMQIFSNVFFVNADVLEEKSKNISLYWTDNYIYVGDIKISRDFLNKTDDELFNTSSRKKTDSPVVLASQLEILKNLAECILMEKPVLLCGPTDSGKTKSIDLVCTMINRSYEVDTIDDSVTGNFQQIDLNRHLEEVSEIVESFLNGVLQILVVQNQEHDTGLVNTRCTITNLLHHWEMYNKLLANKKYNSVQPAMSEELELFKKRMNSLEQIIDLFKSLRLSKWDHLKNISSILPTVETVLQALAKIIKNAETLNTGGHFEWVDSKIVKCLKFGHFICLEHVNLCSSAILDRLNPVFEPNGKLLISEKAVSADNELEIVGKHRNFRAFLTLDPKNGEISRAMRNRCLEIAINKESYLANDIQSLIYANGITDMYMIKSIKNIHNRLKSLSEYSNFGISHILKFTFLVVENKKLGLSDREALSKSANEVYIRPTNIDILGYGIQFYRNKLQDELIEELKNVKKFENIFSYNSVVLRSDQLNKTSMIKVQCEPFFTILNCILRNRSDINEVLMDLSNDFKDLKIDNAKDLLQYFIYSIYDVSSYEDLKWRKIYIDYILKKIDNRSDLILNLKKMNEDLCQYIHNFLSTQEKNLIPSIPWNSKIFPRIRDYKLKQFDETEQLRLSLIILWKSLVSEIQVDSNLRLNQIGALTYSKAVQTKILRDSVENELITNLYSFLSNLEKYFIDKVNLSEINKKSFVELMTISLWRERLLEISKSKLLKNKEISDQLMDQLVVHFKWMMKNSLSLLTNSPIMKNQLILNQASINFTKSLQAIFNYILNNKHPLNLMRKFYVKNFMNFLPFFEEDQIKTDELLRDCDNNFLIVTKIKSPIHSEVVKKMNITRTEEYLEIQPKIYNQLNQMKSFSWLTQDICTSEKILPESFRESISEFLRQAEILKNSEEAIDFDVAEITCDIRKILTRDCANQKMRTINIELIPILEYFALRKLSITKRILLGEVQNNDINVDYFLKSKYTDSEMLKLINLISQPQFKICLKFWTSIQKHLIDANNDTDQIIIQMILKNMPNEFYKNFSTMIRSINRMIQNATLDSLAIQNNLLASIDCPEKFNESANEKLSINGPIMSLAVSSMLFLTSGELKSAELGEVDLYKSNLNSLSKILWGNMEMISSQTNFQLSDFSVAIQLAKKLLAEIDYTKKLCHEIDNENFTDFNEDFYKLVSKCDTFANDSSKLITPGNDILDNPKRKQMIQMSSLIYSILGSIEINLLCYLPLLDPVEKNKLKNKYNEIDSIHLKNIITAYKAMGIISNYKILGGEIIEIMNNKMNALKERKISLSKKLALRPEKCLYRDLVKDVNHFLQTCCHPKSLLTLITESESCLKFEIDQTDLQNNIKNSKEFLSNTNEMIKRIELWINNSEKFQYHTLQSYSAYYRDFLEPIECSITILKYGLNSLRSSLIEVRDSLLVKSNGSSFDINADYFLNDALENLINFPSFANSNNCGTTGKMIHISTLISNLQDGDRLYFKLLKSTLQDLRNKILIRQSLPEDIINDYENILNNFNKIWQKQEENRRKKQMEDDSLYVMKTKCETESEEDIEMEEFQSIFPNQMNDDFGEFIQNDTLEQIKSNPPRNNKQKLQDVFTMDDYKIICDNFIQTFELNSKNYYYNPFIFNHNISYEKDYLTSYQTKISIFYHLLNKYKTCTSSRIDDIFYPGLSFIIDLNLQRLNLISENTIKDYNYYKDPNIAEIIPCVTILKAIEARVEVELQHWPDHAVLNDIILIINRIRSLPVTSPITRFNTGFQLLRKKISEWNSVAHKNNNLLDLGIKVAEHIQRWTKLELQYWRECLSQSYERVQNNAYKYWFFIYNLLKEYLDCPSLGLCINVNTIDFDSVEDSFIGALQQDNGTDRSIKIKTEEVIKVLQQFMETSNYAEFGLRLKLIKSFELYLHHIEVKNIKRKENLISIMHNIHIYFYQFLTSIEETIKTTRAPIEKTLKDFVKIESFNKDLSYIGMKNNIMKIQKNVHKFFKQFETALKNKISPVFSQKSDSNLDISFDNDKGVNLRFEAKVKYYMVDVKNFIASPRLKEKFSLYQNVNVESSSYLKKIDKLFLTSRNIVKHAILHSQFPGLIFNLDCLLAAQIETCEYLQKLEVNRKQEFVKQKTQAKQILNQKRKALSDCYKTLTTLGLNFKTGLMEFSLKPEFINLKISPFCIKTMISDQKHKKITNNMVFLNEKLDFYYSKCIFKIKMLLNTFLTPNADLGLQNIERIKGFSVDMFLLIQVQRTLLSKSVRNLYDFSTNLDNLYILDECLSETSNKNKQAVLNFDFLFTKLEIISNCATTVRAVLEQYQLFLNCAPKELDPKFNVLKENQFNLAQNTEKYTIIKAKSRAILENSKKLLEELRKQNDIKFPNYKTVVACENMFYQIIYDLQKLKDEFEFNGEHLIACKPIIDLLSLLNLESEKITAYQRPKEKIGNETDKINIELDNIIHSVLLSIQKLHKKYSSPNNDKIEVTQFTVESEKQTCDNLNEDEYDEQENLISENHLKQLIHSEMQSDIESLNLEAINKKLSYILLELKYNTDITFKEMTIRKLTTVIPLLEQFSLFVKYYLIQQLGAHKVSTKMLSVMLTVFVELGSKGFCVPPDLLRDEEKQEEQQESNQKGEGFGLEDGTGEKDVSDRIESEDQLEDAKKPGDEKNAEDKEESDCKEEKGIEMSEDFESNLQDMDKKADDEEGSDKSDEEEDPDKQMGETEDGAEKLDDQIWGSDEEPGESEDEEDDMNKEDGKGSDEKNEGHNDLSSQNEKQHGEDDTGLDAAEENNENEKKKKEKDIDKMEEPEVNEEQTNPYHNELEEPPEAEPMDLDNCNLDNEEPRENEENGEDNPFDIDTMKDQMPNEMDESEDENNGDDSKKNEAESESENEDDVTDKITDPSESIDEKLEEEPAENKEDVEKSTGTTEQENIDEEENDKDKDELLEEDQNKKIENHHQSKDKNSLEDNVQAMPNDQNKGSNDQVQTEAKENPQVGADEIDEQNTGEDKEGVGQAENEESKTGHQGVVDSKQAKSDENSADKNENQEKRKQGNTDEDRTLGESNKMEPKLKTIDKLRDTKSKQENEESLEKEANEFQHIRDAKGSDRTTMDNATEEQSKKVHHKEAEEEPNIDDENNDELLETEEIVEDQIEDADAEMSEKIDKPSDKAAKSNEKIKEKCEAQDNAEVEGSNVSTMNIPRGSDTTAHCQLDIVHDSTICEEPSMVEALEMRRLFEAEITTNKIIHPGHDDFEIWQQICNQMMSNARDLCEQLRLILEPTKCTRLKGDYRTGRRINMRKIIPYLASQFRKDKIWLRRTKPAQRDYKITIAIDDSKSMHHNNSKTLTLQAISLVSQALTLLESGKLSIISFGETPQIIMNHTDQFDGPKLVKFLNFSQNQSRIAELLNFVRTANQEQETSSGNGIFENLLLILSDGRNIFSEGEQKVKNAVKLARLQRIFVVYIIIDNPENNHSVMDIRVPCFSADRKTISMKSYLDMFPFPYYVIVRDLGQLPLVLSDAMRQWFELVNSEQ